MEETDEQPKGKTKRLAIWATVIIVLGGVASYVLPEHSLPYFMELLRDIVTNVVAV
jgi:hypothetical protein